MEGTHYTEAAGVLTAFFTYIGLHFAWRRYRRVTTLRRAAGALTDAVIDEGRGIVTGRVEGRGARCELTSRGSGSGSVAWTEVSITMDGPTLELELRPQTLVEEIDLKRGMAIDVATGDPSFDRAFIVEGAPADAVREVLADEALRLALMRLGAVEATQVGGAVMLAKKGWVWGGELATMATTAGALAARLAQVGAKIARVEGDAYRGDRPDPAGPHAARERQALAEARATRERKWSTTSVGVAVGVALFALAWLAAVFAAK